MDYSPPFPVPDCLIDLHLHLDGSLSLACVRRLAEMQQISLPEDDESLRSRLSVLDGCRDLNEYLTRFEFPCSLLQAEQALEEAAAILCGELREQGLIYAEIRFAPQKHCDCGLTQDAAVCAVLHGMRRSELPAGLILCCMRGADNHAKNLDTLRVAAEYRDAGVCAVDLAGAEALFPNRDYADLFSEAERLGLHCTIHAGEADGPQSIADALDLGAERIGHGVRCVEDAAMMRRLADAQIPLELCPTSNLNTAVFADLAEYPLPAILDAGIPATLNTDNMTVSGTTLRREWEKLLAAVPLTGSQIRTLLQNSARAAFADDATKEKLLRIIDEKTTFLR